MTIVPIVTVPDPVLKQRATEVGTVDDALRRQMDNMLDTMYDAPGIGLAANQIGLLNRVLVMDLSERLEDGVEPKRNPIYMVNPEIIFKSEEPSEMEEGCLSIPGQYALVQRPAIVRVKYLDYNGQGQEMEASGLLSHCVQHEIDHLNGVLFIDHLSKLKRDMIMKKLAKHRIRQDQDDADRAGYWAYNGRS